MALWGRLTDPQPSALCSTFNRHDCSGRGWVASPRALNLVSQLLHSRLCGGERAESVPSENTIKRPSPLGAAVAGLQTVGIILGGAMLVTPGATAYLLTDRFDRMTWLAIGSSVLSSLVGVYVSYWTDSSTAGCIVLVQTGLFLLAFLLAPQHGILRRSSP